MDFSTIKSITIPDGIVTKISCGDDVLWDKANALPSEYQQVEWIRAANGVEAYFKLGFSFDTAARIRIGAFIENDTSTYLFGAAEDSGKFRCMLSVPYGGGFNGSAYGSHGTNFISVNVTLKEGLNELEYTIEKGNLTLTNITNGYTDKNTTQAEYTMSSELYLFAQNYNGTIRCLGTRKISYFEYYDKNDILICSLIPCYRKSDYVVGMYDIVRNIFLDKIGSGIFTPYIKFNAVNVVPQSVESDGVTIYNGGKGYKDGYRVRSVGTEVEAENATIIGYIPFVKGDKLYIYPPFRPIETNSINFYDSAFNNLGQVTDSGSFYGFCSGHSEFKTEIIKGVSVLDISEITVSGIEKVAFVRITHESSTCESVGGLTITKNEELSL